MRIIIFLLAMILAIGAQAQSWTVTNDYRQQKGLIADSALRAPRLNDTISLAGNKDSIGLILYHVPTKSLWWKRPGEWKRIASAGEAATIFASSGVYRDVDTLKLGGNYKITQLTGGDGDVFVVWHVSDSTNSTAQLILDSGVARMGATDGNHNATVSVSAQNHGAGQARGVYASWDGTTMKIDSTGFRFGIGGLNANKEILQPQFFFNAVDSTVRWYRYKNNTARDSVLSTDSAGNVRLARLGQSSIIGLQDSLLAKPTYTAADARYVPQTRTLALTAGAGISITGGTQSLAANRTWTVTNTGILNQLATQETKDFRISGYGYVGKLRVGFNSTTTIPTNIYSAYNSGADSHAKFVSFFKANETGADSTGTIQFVRIDNNTINLSDPDYANSYVKSGTFIGQVVGTGAIQDQSVASGAISLGKPVVKLTMHAESDFTSFTAATASLRGYFKTNAETVATEKWRIQPNGFMGLMTNNPQATIHAKGLSASTGSVLRLENSAGTILYEVFNNNTTQNTGAQINAVVSTGVNRTIQATDYIVRATAAGITITVPVPTAIGRYVVIKNRSGGNITVAMSGGATIDGSGTSITVASGDVLRLSGASGTDWDKL